MKTKKHPQGRKKIDDAHDTVIIGFRDSSVLKKRFVKAAERLGLNCSEVLRVLTKDFIKKIEGL